MSGNDRDRQVKNVRSPIRLNEFFNCDGLVLFSGDFVRKRRYNDGIRHTSLRKLNRTRSKGAESE